MVRKRAQDGLNTILKTTLVIGIGWILVAGSLLAFQSNAASYSGPSQHGLAAGSVVSEQLHDHGAIPSCTNCIIKNISLGDDDVPGGIAYDSLDGDLFVMNTQTNGVAVVSGATNTLITDTQLPYGEACTCPSSVAIDTSAGEAFAFDNLDSNISVISDISDKVVANISAEGTRPGGAAYDQKKNEMFVDSDGIMKVINGTTNKVTATIVMSPNYPLGVAYANSSGQVLMANGGDTIFVISDSNNTVTKSITVKGDPYWLTYDYRKGEIFASSLSGNVSVINVTTDSIVNTVHTNDTSSLEAFGIAYDPQVGEVFVLNGTNVDVISDSLNKVVAIIPLGVDPSQMAYDSGNGDVYVTTDGNTGELAVIAPAAVNSTLQSVSVSPPSVNLPPKGTVGLVATPSCTITCPAGTIYSWALTRSALGVLNASVGNKVSFTAGNVSGSAALFVNATLNGITVQSSPVPIAVVAKTSMLYQANFTETGLPGGTRWSVTMNVTTNTSTTATIGFTVANGSYSYTIGAVPGFTTAYTSGLFVINGASGIVSIDFIPNPKDTYSVIFQEAGMPSGKIWTVGLNQSQNSSQVYYIIFTERNGTYQYLIAPPTGYNATPFSGSVAVSGRTVYVNVTITPSSVTTTYSVTFSEAGLPEGVEWYLNVTGHSPITSTNDTASISLANGTYAIKIATGYKQYEPGISTSRINVSGRSLSLDVVFSLVTYAVSLNETGLPSGTSWSAVLNYTIAWTEGSVTENKTTSLHESSSTKSVEFASPNGTDTFTIGEVSGYSVDHESGVVSVDGSSTSVMITFTLIPKGQYSLDFGEEGLPSGTNWSVDLNGQTRSSTTSTISFFEVNGTYSFVTGTIAGFSSSMGSGSVTINGADLTRTIDFTEIPKGEYQVVFSETGLSSGTNWSITLGGVQVYSEGGTASFMEANDTYSYTVGTVPGYSASPSSGSLTVSGRGSNVTILFKQTATSPPEVLGLSIGLWEVVIGIMVVAVVGVVIGLYLVRKKPDPEKKHTQEDAPPQEGWT